MNIHNYFLILFVPLSILHCASKAALLKHYNEIEKIHIFSASILNDTHKLLLNDTETMELTGPNQVPYNELYDAARIKGIKGITDRVPLLKNDQFNGIITEYQIKLNHKKAEELFYENISKLKNPKIAKHKETRELPGYEKFNEYFNKEINKLRESKLLHIKLIEQTYLDILNSKTAIEFFEQNKNQAFLFFILGASTIPAQFGHIYIPYHSLPQERKYTNRKSTKRNDQAGDLILLPPIELDLSFFVYHDLRFAKSKDQNLIRNGNTFLGYRYYDYNDLNQARYKISYYENKYKKSIGYNNHYIASQEVVYDFDEKLFNKTNDSILNESINKFYNDLSTKLPDINLDEKKEDESLIGKVGEVYLYNKESGRLVILRYGKIDIPIQTNLYIRLTNGSIEPVQVKEIKHTNIIGYVKKGININKKTQVYMYKNSSNQKTIDGEYQFTQIGSIYNKEKTYNIHVEVPISDIKKEDLIYCYTENASIAVLTIKEIRERKIELYHSNKDFQINKGTKAYIKRLSRE